MSFLYGAADEKFIRTQELVRKPKLHPLQQYKFFVHPLVRGRDYYDKNDVPIVFKTTPDTLQHLCIKVIDAIPLPPVYKWTELEICRWLRNLGFPQYQRTFRDNLINGRTLLLLDASALQAMNIRNFDHIKKLTEAIRLLYFFEMTKFGRSISLPPQYYYELYKLFHVKTGFKYESVRRSDLWRRMQLLRKISPNYSHWEVLERWMSFVKDFEFPELFGGVRRYQLYKCKKEPKRAPEEISETLTCNCIPPCTCHWTEDDVRKPWRLSVLSAESDNVRESAELQEDFWKLSEPLSKRVSIETLFFPPRTTISYLAEAMPNKYGSTHGNNRTPNRVSFLIEKKSRYS